MLRNRLYQVLVIRLNERRWFKAFQDKLRVPSPHDGVGGADEADLSQAADIATWMVAQQGMGERFHRFRSPKETNSGVEVSSKPPPIAGP